MDIAGTVLETPPAGQLAPPRHGWPASAAEDQDAVAGPCETQGLDRQLLDHVRVAGIEEPNVALQAGTNGLQASDIMTQGAGALNEARPCLQAALAADGVISEIADRQQAA